MEKANALTNLITKVPREVRVKVAEYFNEPQNEKEFLELAVLISGDINIVKEKITALEGSIVDLGFNFAVISIRGENLDKALQIPEIRYFELPKPMYASSLASNKSSCITRVWESYNLTGKGVIVGFIDSGIDYMHPAFRNEDGTTRIKYIYDIQSDMVYTEEDINNAIKAPNPLSIVNQVDTSGHGTHVAGIACGGGKINKDYYGVAYESSIIMVKMTRTKQANFAQSTQLMKGVKFLIDKSKELKAPLVINLSFSTNDGAHDGESLLELYIKTVSELERLNFVIAAGNEGESGHHVGGIIQPQQSIGFNMGPDERIIVLQLYKNFLSELSIEIKDSSGRSSGIVPLNKSYISSNIGLDSYYIYNSGPQPFNLNGETVITLIPLRTTLTPGVWTINLYSNSNLKNQEYNIWLPISEGLSPSTKFLSPNPYNTLGIPGTVMTAITVGSYNAVTNNLSAFSGRGPRSFQSIKPDLVAPGENIESASPNRSFTTMSGTSMATPMVAGASALLMEWGIVKGNDVYMYGDRVKYFLIKGAVRNRTDISYPDPSWGYGTLCLSNSMEAWINEGMVRSRHNMRNIRLEENFVIPSIEIKKKIKSNGEKERGCGCKEKLGQEEYGNDYENPRVSQGGEEFCKKGFYDPNYESIIILYEGDIKETLKKIEYACATVLDDNYALLVVESSKKNEVIKSIPQITYVDKGTLYTLNSVSPLETANIEKFHDAPYLNLRGNGVLIGIIDTGIDYLNKEFMYEDDTTRIAAIWDQTIQEGPGPEKIGLGTEYKREQINAAITAHKEGKDPYQIVKSKDEIGHGTKVAGIAGARDGSIGAAPDCELVMVKLKPAEKVFLDEIGINAPNTPVYDGSNLILGINYLYNFYKKEKKPMVILIPLGGNFGAHDGSTLLERFIDDISRSRGVVVVTGTGNEGDVGIHAEGKLNNNGEIQTVELKVDDNEENLIVSIWGRMPDKIAVGIVSPSGEAIDRVPPKLGFLYDFNLVFERSKVFINYFLPEELTGDELITILIKNIKGGIWQIKLYGDYIVNGKYDMWIPSSQLIKSGTKFLNASPYTTLTTPGTSRTAIVTSAYDQNNSTILGYSGRGYTRDGRVKPDVTTGGINVRTTMVGGGESVVSGSSAASAVLAGAVALILEWGIVQKNDTNMYSNKVKALLIRGTKKRDGDIYPNTQWGYGMLDLEGLFKAFRGYEEDMDSYIRLFKDDNIVEVDDIIESKNIKGKVLVRIPEEILISLNK
ncbi:Subtilisin-like serine proteases [Clostridium collagenovorans DSM 3089]|uniref:Subtilisin-like serine proteases n=1 Tax=Clostridium collagenovorans DSM 3089 TaxID=1121306 RepID=A0A1M5Y915_9CLOT|nr:S8 family peptidase [Clostridium collagenovorans]SHI08472.1 Subtilisin-like serine proteases [Clostridium collagenovorans DSM 3089]